MLASHDIDNVIVGNSTPWRSWKRDTFISNVVFFPRCLGKLLWWGMYSLAGTWTLYCTCHLNVQRKIQHMSQSVVLSCDLPSGFMTEAWTIMWPSVRLYDRRVNRHVTFRQVCITQAFIFIPCTLLTHNMSLICIWHVLDLDLRVFQTGWFPCLLCYNMHTLYEQIIYSFHPSNVLAGCYTF